MATLTTSYQLIASKYIGAANSSTNKNIYLRIYAKYTSQSIVDNKSYVSYKSTLYVEGGGTYFYTGSTTTKSLSGTGATSTSGDAQGNYYLGETPLCEISGAVAHSSTGAASVSVTAGWISTPWGISGSLTGTATLPTIARATTPTLSASSVTMDGKNKVDITISPADKSFKHKLRYDFGNLTGQTSGLSAGTSNYTAAGNTTVTFTPPVSLGSQIPSANSGVCKVICYTYTSGGSHIGTKELNLTLNVPSYTPTISSVSLTGNNLRDGVYVQGKSTATIKTVASGAYGSTITSYSCTVDGVKYTKSEFTTAALKSAGAYNLTVNVTDSRGKTASKPVSAFTVYEYKPPYISSFTAERQADGTTVIATLAGGVSPLNSKNGKVFSIHLNGETKTLTATGFTVNGTATFTGVDTDSTFVATARVADYYTEATMPIVVPTESVTMDFHHSGNGVAFGKVSQTENLLDCMWNIKSHGTFSSSEYSKLIGFKYLSTIDLNTVKTAGMYGVYNATNAPEANIATLEVITYSPDWLVQRFTVVGSGSTYTRRWHSGNTWSAWERVELRTTLLSTTLNNTTTTGTLAQTIANFQFIEVYFHDNDNLYDSIKIRNNYSATTKATVGHPQIGSYGYIKTLRLEINGTTATVSNNKQIPISTTMGSESSANGVISVGNFIIIDSIVGVK